MSVGPVRYPVFRLRSVFPQDEDHAVFIVFLMATRWLLAIMRIQPLPHEQTAAGQEDLHYLFLAAVSAAKEAADKFWMADERKWFNWLARTDIPELAGEKQALERVKRVCEKKDPSSLYRRVLSPPGMPPVHIGT